MNSFIEHMDNITTTENGGKAYKSTLNKCLDFFYLAGNLGSDIEDRKDAYNKAYMENSETATLILLWSRGIKSGAGIKNLFREVLGNKVDLLVALIKDGEASWKDFFYLFEVALKKKDDSRYDYTRVIKNELEVKTDRLFFKWFPRSGRVWQYIYKTYGAKNLRKMLVKNTDVVETKMSSNSWNEIAYETIPSRAMNLYGKNAFHKHDAERFSIFLNNKTAKINSSCLFPHEVIKTFRYEKIELAQKQWDNLPDYIGKNISFLPIIDVSGSMTTSYNGVAPIDVATSLGIYLSERNKSVFKDRVILFSDDTKWLSLSGNLENRVKEIDRYSMATNTNLELVFKSILNACIDAKVSQKDLPSHLLIITDGQFDQMCNGNDVTVFKKYQKDFKAHGYKLPKVVFWNVAGYNNFPTTDKERDVLLFSGYTPNSLVNLLKGATPLEGMLNAIEKFRKYIN